MKPFLIFDAYGTLVELDDFYGRLQRGFAHRGVSLPLNVIQKAAHEEMRHYILHSKRARDMASWLQVRRECAHVLADAVRAQGHEFGLAINQVSEVLGESVVFRVFPEVRAALIELKKRGFSMGVLSNWDYRLPLALSDLGLQPFFEFVQTSAQAGFQKPERSFFERGVEAARQALANMRGAFRPDELKPENCVYIGDHYEKDVLGARQAGLKPFWLVREARDLTSGTTQEADDAVVRLSDLSQLLQVLKPLEATS